MEKPVLIHLPRVADIPTTCVFVTASTNCDDDVNLDYYYVLHFKQVGRFEVIKIEMGGGGHQNCDRNDTERTCGEKTLK